jgi:hypothetical protein
MALDSLSRHTAASRNDNLTLAFVFSMRVHYRQYLRRPELSNVRRVARAKEGRTMNMPARHRCGHHRIQTLHHLGRRRRGQFHAIRAA